MKVIDLIFIGLLSLLLFSFSNREENVLLGNWKLDQFKIKNETIYYNGEPDSCYNALKGLKFEKEEKYKEKLLVVYTDMQEWKLSFRKKTLRVNNSEKKKVVWQQYEILNDTIIYVAKEQRTISFNIDEKCTRLTLVEGFVTSIWKKEK